jgi:hypothetical protein
MKFGMRFFLAVDVAVGTINGWQPLDRMCLTVDVAAILIPGLPTGSPGLRIAGEGVVEAVNTGRIAIPLLKEVQGIGKLLQFAELTQKDNFAHFGHLAQ